ncbi:MAG: hypothetical protein K1Y02_26025 [Candidatus Hydrogenedentes bacterium]|nr:hypothetical protein [Candidatus Hydrogenedentota bacterium]
MKPSVTKFAQAAYTHALSLAYAAKSGPSTDEHLAYLSGYGQAIEDICGKAEASHMRSIAISELRESQLRKRKP